MSDIITTLHPENDAETNLYPNIKKENIPSESIDRSKLDSNINGLLNNIGENHPSGVSTSATILAFTEDKGIYVGSDTGNWYYWNGTNYVSGGVYQAMNVQDGSITYNKLNSSLINRYADNDNMLFNANAIQRGKLYTTYYLNIDSTTVFEVPVTSGTTYFFYPNVRHISKSGTVLLNGTADGTGPISYTPDFTGTLYVTFFNKDSGWIMTTKSDFTGIQGYKFNGLSSEKTKYLEPDNLLFTAKRFFRNKQYYTYLTDLNTSCVFDIDVTSGTTYYIYPGFRWLSKDGVNILNGTQYGSGPYAYTPDFTGTLHITFRNSDAGYVVTTNPNYLEVQGYYFNNSEKIDKIKVMTFGDSIMYGSALYGVGPCDLLSRKYQQIRNTNNAVSASTLQKNTGYPCIVETMINSNILTDNPDVVIFDGMRNDIGKSTLGTFNDSFDWETNGYTDSFVHAFEYFVGYIRTNLPSALIIYLIPNTSLTATLSDEKDYIDMIKLLCFKWSIPLVNVYEDGNLNPRIREQLLLYTDTSGAEDGTHPNEAGYNRSYLPLIYEKLKNIIIK